MLSAFTLTAAQVAVLFALMAAGAACNRFRLLGEEAVKGIVELLVLIVTPCLIVHVFQRPFDSSLLAGLGVAFAVALAAHAAGILASHAVRPGDARRKSVLRYAVVFSNAGFMGLPLEHALLGEMGVFYGAVYVVVFNLMCWSYGLVVMCGSLRDVRPRTLFVNPGTVGLALGLPLFLFSAKLPQIVAAPVRMIADLNTPLAMIVIGWYLARADFRPVLRSGSAWLAAFLRLGAVPAAVLCGLCAAVRFAPGIDGTLAIAMVASSSAPSAALTTMLAAKYGRDVPVSVGIVAGTTLLSALTMPVATGLAMWLFGG